MNENSEMKRLFYRSPLLRFGITPLMKKMTLEKAAKGETATSDDWEALALARDSQFSSGELDEDAFSEAIDELGDAARDTGETKCAAVFGAAILSGFTRRSFVAEGLSWLARAVHDGLPDAAFPLAGWYADRAEENDLSDFPDFDPPGFEQGYEPKRGCPPVQFPETRAECVERAFYWSLVGLASELDECDECLERIPWTDDLAEQYADLLEKAAATPWAFAAKRILAGRLLRKQASSKEHARGLALFRELAKDGTPDDFFALSMALKETIGEQADSTPEEAFKWCLKAAEGGIPTAMRELSFLYDEGLGVERNPELACKWMCDGAEAGDGACRLMAGKMLFDIAKTPKDFREAVRWIRAAAEEDDIPGAWAMLSDIYTTGSGLYVNKKKAADCLKRAKALGWEPDSETTKNNTPAP